MDVAQGRHPDLGECGGGVGCEHPACGRQGRAVAVPPGLGFVRLQGQARQDASAAQLACPVGDPLGGLAVGVGVREEQADGEVLVGVGSGHFAVASEPPLRRGFEGIDQVGQALGEDVVVAVRMAV